MFEATKRPKPEQLQQRPLPQPGLTDGIGASDMQELPSGGNASPTIPCRVPAAAERPADSVFGGVAAAIEVQPQPTRQRQLVGRGGRVTTPAPIAVRVSSEAARFGVRSNP